MSKVKDCKKITLAWVKKQKVTSKKVINDIANIILFPAMTKIISDSSYDYNTIVDGKVIHENTCCIEIILTDAIDMIPLYELFKSYKFKDDAFVVQDVKLYL